MKPKENKGNKVGTYDECQTPPYALEPLFPYLNKDWFIWECACGSHTLWKALLMAGLKTDGTDIKHGEDFFNPLLSNYVLDWNCIVTNPPYSIKYEWLKKCYELGRPFALLMPVEMLGTKRGQDLFDEYGIQVIFVQPRIDFYMPNKGYEGGGAQFPTAWFTWKLNLPKQMNFARLNKPKRSELGEYWKEALGE